MNSNKITATQIAIVFKENPEEPVAFITMKPFHEVLSQCGGDHEDAEVIGPWSLRIDQAPTKDAIDGFTVFITWDSIQMIQLREVDLIDLGPIPPSTGDGNSSGPSLPPPDSDDDGGGPKIPRHQPPKVPAGGRTRKVPVVVK